MSHKIYQTPHPAGGFELLDGPKPQVEAADEVLVKMKAVALNPLDVLQLNYGFMVAEWPAVLGYEGSGVVEAVGKDVKDLKVGDGVFGMFAANGRRSGAFQEYTVVKEMHMAKKPENVSFEDAASLPSGYATALACIYDGIGTPLPFISNGPKNGFEPKSVLVLGGSGAMGSATVRLLRITFPEATILATSSTKHHGLIKKLGGAGIDRSSATIVEDIRSSSPDGQGVDAIIDCVGGAAANRDILNAFNSTGPKKLAELVTANTLKEIPEGVHHKQVDATSVWGFDVGKTALPALGDLVESGKWPIAVPVRVLGIGWEHIPEGIQILGKGVSGTKLIVSV